MAPPGVRRAWRYLLTAAGPHRTQRRNLQLASLLAFSAGVLNSVGFVAVAVYTSHVTGLTAGIADHLVLGQHEVVLAGVLGLTAFVAGAATCALVFNWGRRRNLKGRYANVLVLEALLVLAFGLLADKLTWGGREFIFIVVLCFTMGMQNAVITKISRAQIRTTHVTGMVTDIGIELGKLVYWNRRRVDGRADALGPREGLDLPVQADLRKLGLLSMLVGLFFVGGLVGALGYLRFGFAVVIPLALFLLANAAAPLVADLRALSTRRTARRGARRPGPVPDASPGTPGRDVLEPAAEASAGAEQQKVGGSGPPQNPPVA